MPANYSFQILDDHTDEVIHATEEAIERALEAIGFQAEGYVKALAPTSPHGGNLKNSITHQVAMDDEDGPSVYIGTNVEYAPYVEFGTGKYADEGGRSTPWWYQDDKGQWHYTHGQKPKHFMRDGIEKNANEFKAIAESFLKNI